MLKQSVDLTIYGTMVLRTKRPHTKRKHGTFQTGPPRTTYPKSYKIQIALIKKTFSCSLVAIPPLSFLFDGFSEHDTCCCQLCLCKRKLH
jgi:hypothetical protein